MSVTPRIFSGLYKEYLPLKNHALPPRKAPAVHFSDVIERAGERVLPARSCFEVYSSHSAPNVDSLIVKYLNSSRNYSTRGKYLVWVKVLNI